MVEVAAAAPSDLTVRQLLQLPVLAGSEVLAGGAGLDAVATSVLVAPAGRLTGDGEPGAVLVIDGTRLAEDNYYVDFALRWAEENSAVMVLILRPSAQIGLASERLAAKLGIPLVVVDGDPTSIYDQLRDHVQAPTRYLALLLMELIDGLGRVSPKHGVDGVLQALDSALDARSALVGYEGGVIAGAQSEPPLASTDLLPVQHSIQVEDRLRFVQPVALVAGEAPTFWIVTERKAPTRTWQRAASTGLQLAASYVATRLMSTRIERERDARFRLGVLNAIIAAAEYPDSGLIQQVGTLGWKVDGWCTAIHINAAGQPNQQRLLAVTDELRHALVEIGLGEHVVERPDGWTTWRSDTNEPAATSYTRLTAAVGQVLRNFAGRRTGLRIYAGIGRPYSGVSGLRKSLSEAQEASTIAQAGGGRAAVQHVDEMGIQRILFGWYASKDFGAFAQTLLRPILTDDREDQLLKTLEVFLDNESSPSVTADVLGVHRNTVVNRISRVRELLSVDLDEPDQRLAVQLACRVVNLQG